jgi:predicted  nucleic acid-binding Zn-ribbon protein
MRTNALIALQDVDARLHLLRRRREDIPRALADADERLARDREALQAFLAKQKQDRVATDHRELDLKTLESRIEKLETQLNTVKTNKEYALLKKEIDGLKADKAVIDDEILQQMLQHEEQDKEGQAHAAHQKEEETALQSERRKAEAALAELDREIGGLQRERDAAATQVDPDLLRVYQRILDAKRDGTAIVPVVDGVCQGCYIDITSQEVNLLLIGRDVLTCRNCSRILYIAKEPAAARKSAPSKSPAAEGG